VPKRIAVISILAVLGLCSAPLPSLGQALLPYTLQVDTQDLEEQGLKLAQDAVRLIRFGRIELALPRAELASQLAPRRYQTWLILGTLYAQQRQFDQAITALQRAKSLAPEEAAVYFALGSARFQKKDYEGAIADLQIGLRLKPETPDAWFDLGNAHLQLKQFSEATTAYERAVAVEKDFWPALTNIGLVLYEQGKPREAIAKWQASITIDPQAVEPKLAIAIATFALGERERAITLGTEALRLDLRYADLEFLRQNLWGERLIATSKEFFELPQVQTAINQIQRQSTPILTTP
jgi:tetratricopeptide (TPR) repeat protein